ncbi:MAG: hypothetical protein ACPGLV_03595 [Bacteroidia bacterium]
MKHLVIAAFIMTFFSCKEKIKHQIISGNGGNGTPCDSVFIDETNRQFNKDENGNYYYDLTVNNGSKFDLTNVNVQFLIYKNSRADLPFEHFTIHFDLKIPSDSQISKRIYKGDVGSPFSLKTGYMVDEQAFNKLFDVNLDSVRLFPSGLKCWHEYQYK